MVLPDQQGSFDEDQLLGDQRLVVRAANAGSISAAARTMGIQASTVSRALQRVETVVGARLFARTARGLRPTDAGATYIEHLRDIIAREDAVRSYLSDSSQSGRLHITMPAVVASRILPDTVVRLRRTLPRLSLDINATDTMVDLIRGGVDLAIRLGPLQASSLRTRRVAKFRRIIVAAPGLLDAVEPVIGPEDLSAHPCLSYGRPAQPAPWRFIGPRGRRVEVTVTGPVRANDSPLLVALAERGLGFARVPQWLVTNALSEGRLLQILPDWRCDGQDNLPTMFAVWPDDPAKTKARRAFLHAFELTLRALSDDSIVVRGGNPTDRP